MLPVSLGCVRPVSSQKQSRYTDNIVYTRWRQTKQKQSRDTDNIGYTRWRKNKTKTIQRHWQHRVHKTKKTMLLVSLDCFCFVFSSSCVPYVVSVSGLFLFCFSSSCVPYVVSVSGLFLFCFFFILCTLCCQCLWKQKQSRDTNNIEYTRWRKNKTKTIQRHWQHRVHKMKKNKTKTIQRHWQHRVHKMKKNYVVSVSGLFLFCFSSSCVLYVVSVSRLFLFCLSSSCVLYVVSVSGLFLFCLSSSCDKQNKNNPETLTT
jgi:Flp pilus assembly protein TadB